MSRSMHEDVGVEARSAASPVGVVTEEPCAARPAGRWAMRMTWTNLLFMHWPADAAHVQSQLPASLEVETFDGAAWVGLIPFRMENVRKRWLPRVPTTHAFPECNVRTYVHPRGRPDLPGVWFFTLDAASRVAVEVARRLWKLNYKFGKLSIERTSDEVRYAVNRLDSPRASMACAWTVGEALPRSQPGELQYFATERYRLFAVNRCGDVFEGPIWHERWTLREARVTMLRDSLVSAAGIHVDTAQSPVTWHADRMDVEAWPIAPLRGETSTRQQVNKSKC